MTVTYCNQKIPPKEYAKALDAYIKKHGYQTPPTETIDIHVEGGKVVIRFVTLKETS